MLILLMANTIIQTGDDVQKETRVIPMSPHTTFWGVIVFPMNTAHRPFAMVWTCLMHVRTKVKNGGAANGAAVGAGLVPARKILQF